MNFQFTLAAMKNTDIFKGKIIWGHLAVLTCFLAYLVFFAVPLFNLIEKAPYESRQIEMTLPSPTNDVTYWFVSTMAAADSIQVIGCALIDDHEAQKASIFVVLSAHENNGRRYIFDTQQFANLIYRLNINGRDIDAGNAKFFCCIPIKGLEPGTYQVGLYLMADNIKSFENTNYVLKSTGQRADITVKLSSGQNIDLPAESGDLRFFIDRVHKAYFFDDQHTVIEIVGWAFIDGESPELQSVYVVLDSPDRQYIFDANSCTRANLSQVIGDNSTKLDNAGFTARILFSDIKDGTYRLGLYIRSSDKGKLQYTDHSLNVREGDVEWMPEVASPQAMELPATSGGIIYFVDNIEKETVLKQELIFMWGWAFLDGKDSVGQKIYVVLQSDSDTYVYDTLPQKRPGVTAAYKSTRLSLDDTGFLTRIDTGQLLDGKYRIGLCVTRRSEQGLQFTNRLLMKSQGLITISKQ